MKSAGTQVSSRQRASSPGEGSESDPSEWRRATLGLGLACPSWAHSECRDEDQSLAVALQTPRVRRRGDRKSVPLVTMGLDNGLCGHGKVTHRSKARAGPAPLSAAAINSSTAVVNPPDACPRGRLLGAETAGSVSASHPPHCPVGPLSVASLFVSAISSWPASRGDRDRDAFQGPGEAGRGRHSRAVAAGTRCPAMRTCL